LEKGAGGGRTVCQDDIHDWSQALNERYVGSHSNDMAHVWFLDADGDHGYGDAYDDGRAGYSFCQLTTAY
jgi:hypothetical protein